MNEWMERLFTMSLQAGILVLCVLLLQRLVKRAVSPRLRYALWLLPALRLLLPFTFESGASVMNLLSAPSFVSQAGNAEAAYVPPAAVTTPVPGAAASAPPALWDTANAPAQAALGLMDILFWIWLAGAALTTVFLLFTNLRFYHKARRERTALELPFQTKVYRMAGLSSPCLCGFFKPYILVNDAALKNERTFRLVLRHELSHKKQGDQWWGLLRSLCCAVHWFNPLVWLAAVKSRSDCELACDARVMRGFTQEQCERYGMALLAIIREGAGNAGVFSATTSMTGGKRELFERVAFIGKRPKAALWVTLTAVLAATAMGFAACSDRAEPPAPAYTPAQTETAAPTLTPAFSPAPSPSIPAQPAFDRTDMRGVAEEFLTVYFDKMCSMDSDFNWNSADSTMLGGLVAHTQRYYDSMCLLRQWIDHSEFLWEDAYDIERDMGRFVSLDVSSAGVLDTLEPGGAEYMLEGYFHTTAFGTFVEIGMVRRENGAYAIVSVAFPDWKEFNRFCDDFAAYMKQAGLSDYNKSIYLDHLREERDAFIAARDAWKGGTRVWEPFAIHRSLIHLTYYGVTLNSNGTERTESMAESKVSNDHFGREDSGALIDDVLVVSRCLRGALDKDVDLVSYHMQNYDWGDSEAYGTVEYDPKEFFGADMPISRLMRHTTRATARAKRSVNGETFTTRDRVYTSYFAYFTYTQILDSSKEAMEIEVVLQFRFFNAFKDDKTGEWMLCQSEDDCEQWLKTLRFAG